MPNFKRPGCPQRKNTPRPGLAEVHQRRDHAGSGLPNVGHCNPPPHPTPPTLCSAKRQAALQGKQQGTKSTTFFRRPQVARAP